MGNTCQYVCITCIEEVTNNRFGTSELGQGGVCPEMVETNSCIFGSPGLVQNRATQASDEPRFIWVELWHEQPENV